MNLQNILTIAITSGALITPVSLFTQQANFEQKVQTEMLEKADKSDIVLIQKGIDNLQEDVTIIKKVAIEKGLK